MLVALALSTAPRAPSIHMCETRLAAQKLTTWVEDNGGIASNVVVGPTSHDLGLLAGEDFRAGDVVVSIPRACQLVEPDSDAIRRLADAVPDDSWSARLGLMLLAERCKGEDSRLAPYMQTLPATFTVPMFWPPEQVASLNGYPAVQQRLMRQAKFIQSFAEERLSRGDDPDVAAAFSGRSIDANGLGWAVAACSSRASRVVGGSGGGADAGRVLCPLIDMGNHAAKGVANCELRERALGGAVELIATREIALGEELTHSCASRGPGGSGSNFVLLSLSLACRPLGATPTNRHGRLVMRLARVHLSRAFVCACVSTAAAAAAVDRIGLLLLTPDGELPNDDFLLDYGFLPPSPNAHDAIGLAWSDGDLLQSAVATSGLEGLKLDETWRTAAMRRAVPAGFAEASVTRRGVDRHTMAACRVAVASDAAAVRKADGGRKQLAAGGEVRALRLAASMTALALTGLPEKDEGGAAASDDVAASFLSQKRALCTDALATLAERMKSLQAKGAKDELTGNTKGRTASGVRKASAARGGAKASKAAGGGGFGSSKR